MIDSLRIDSDPSATKMSYFSLYNDNSFSGITVQYPSNWIIKKDHKMNVRFFSPIQGPYLLRNEYRISIDIDSVYDSPIDYVSRIVWDRLDQNWYKTVEEASSHSPTYRIIDKMPYSNFEKGQGYILLPLDLRLLNYPNQYKAIFATEIGFIKDGYLCELIDGSNQVSSP
jgi:hypothetical protein